MFALLVAVAGFAPAELPPAFVATRASDVADGAKGFSPDPNFGSRFALLML